MGADFWTWRASQQPRSRDDIPRIERPRDWLPDWSQQSVGNYRRTLRGFVGRWSSIDVTSEPTDVQVDYRLIGSALARVRFELDLLRSWQRDPGFYLDQSLGIVYDLLLSRPPIDDDRATAIAERLAAVPGMLETGLDNLAAADDAVRPFATTTVTELADIRGDLDEAIGCLAPFLSVPAAERVTDAGRRAAGALEHYRDALTARLPTMRAEAGVGREAFEFFLARVALLPFSPEQLLAMGRQEFERAVVFETLERNRNRRRPPLALASDVGSQVDREVRDELAVRSFYEQHGLLTQPGSLRHYGTAPLPAYVRPLSWLGVTNDLTSPSRLGDDAVSYVPAPAPDLPYFYLANARDPRAGIVHEGAHYQQLALSWAQSNPLRRRYYDSGANEGIAFYNEELMLQAGLFDDNPRAREIIYNFMRLRALRVEVDVRLAVGQLDIEGGAEYLRSTVPMDEATAREEAAFFAATPGQGLTYQIGKLQVLSLVAAAARLRGAAFSLRETHDFLWRNGNVPIALQRWEHLGERGDIDRLDEMATRVPTLR